MRQIDMNSDMGESFGKYRLGNDEEIMKYISSTNIACGFHAGDPHILKYTIQLAKKTGTAVGAHPGLPGCWKTERTGSTFFLIRATADCTASRI